MKQTAKAKIAKGTIFLYAMACIIFLVGAVSLYNHVSYFNTMVAGYVAQGYTESEVLSQLMPSQFLPVVFQTISLNLGLAAVLIGGGMIYQNLMPVTLSEDNDLSADEGAQVLNLETVQETETADVAEMTETEVQEDENKTV